MKQAQMPELAVNPDTPLSAVTDVMDQVEMILIMSVLSWLRRPEVYPGVDGEDPYAPAECWMKRDWSMCTFRSMAASTARPSMKSLAAGANIIVAGSAVFGSNIEAERARAAGKNFFIQQKAE